MRLPSFSFRIIPDWLTNGEEGLSPITTSNVLMKTLVFIACAGPLNTAFYALEFTCCCFPRMTPHGHFSVLERRKAVLKFFPCTSLHINHRTVFLQKDKFPPSRIAIWELLHIKTNWRFQACFALLYSKFNTSRFCWNLQLCAKMLGSSEQRSGNTDALERKPRGKRFTRQGASMISRVT